MVTESDALFRKEALDCRALRMSGSVIVPPSKTLTLASLVSAALLALIALLLATGQYAPRYTVQGYLTPKAGLVSLTAPRAGVVNSVLVRDGDLVRTGDRLAVVTVEQSVDGVGVQTRMLQNLSDEEQRIRDQMQVDRSLHESNLRQLKSQLDTLLRQDETLDHEKSILAQELAGAKDLVQRTQVLVDEGIATQVDIYARKQQQFEIERQIESVQRSRTANQDAESDLKRRVQQSPLDATDATTALQNHLTDIATQKSSLEAERTYTIVATADGRVTALRMSPGTAVNTTETLLTIIPDNAELVAELLVPSRAISAVAIGRKVALRYAAFPYQQFGVYEGRIVDISTTALSPENWASSGISPGEPVFRVLASISDQQIVSHGLATRIQSGMLLDADIILEKRPLWQWLFEPLFSLKGHL